MPTSLAFGVSLFLSLQGSFWGLVLVLASLGLVVAIEVGVRGSATRVAMKQPVRDNERFDWRTIVPFIVIYTAWIFLPEGNAVVSALAGAAAAALMLFAYWKWWDA